MTETKRKAPKAVLVKYLIFFAVALILFAGAVWIRYSLRINNLKKDIFNRDGEPVQPVLTPVEFLEAEPAEGNLGVVLEETAPVGDEYFADAVFAGDSLTDGFRIYDVGQHFDVISEVGLSPGAAQTLEMYETPEGDTLTMADAIKYLGSRKAYILLGSNGLEWSSPESLIADYGGLVDILRQTNPDTYIILQSIPPVTEATAQRRTSYLRENVEYYNSLVKNLALEKGVYFLDVYSAFIGENGYLSPEIAAGDGIHMDPPGYRTWFEYITTHTIKGDAAFMMDAEGRIIPMKPADSLPEETGDAAGTPPEEQPAA